MQSRSTTSVPVPEFDGHKTGEDNAKLWLGRFEKVARVRKWKDDEKCLQFSLLLTDAAEKWFYSLEQEHQDNYEDLSSQFRERFFPTELDRPRRVKEFLNSMQGKESVQEYVESIQARGRSLQKSALEIQDVVVNGLRQEIRNFVLTKEAKSLEEIVKFV